MLNPVCDCCFTYIQPSAFQSLPSLCPKLHLATIPTPYPPTHPALAKLGQCFPIYLGSMEAGSSPYQPIYLLEWHSHALRYICYVPRPVQLTCISLQPLLDPKCAWFKKVLPFQYNAVCYCLPEALHKETWTLFGARFLPAVVNPMKASGWLHSTDRGIFFWLSYFFLEVKTKLISF